MKQHREEKIVLLSSALLPLFILHHRYYCNVLFVCKHKTLQRSVRALNRAPGVKNPSMDIWDEGRETEKGTSGQGLEQLKGLKKEEETEGSA